MTLKRDSLERNTATLNIIISQTRGLAQMLASCLGEEPIIREALITIEAARIVFKNRATREFQYRRGLVAMACHSGVQAAQTLLDYFQCTPLLSDDERAAIRRDAHRSDKKKFFQKSMSTYLCDESTPLALRLETVREVLSAWYEWYAG